MKKKIGRPRKENPVELAQISGKVYPYQREFVRNFFKTDGEFLRSVIEAKMEEYLGLGLIDDEAWEKPKKETPKEAFEKWQAEQAKH